jgi:hypothetical protein
MRGTREKILQPKNKIFGDDSERMRQKRMTKNQFD